MTLLIILYSSKFTHCPELASNSSASPHPLISEKVRMQCTQVMKFAVVMCRSLRTRKLRVSQHLKNMWGSWGWMLSSTSRSKWHSEERSGLDQACSPVNDFDSGGPTLKDASLSAFSGSFFSPAAVSFSLGMALETGILPVPMDSSIDNKTAQSCACLMLPACDWMRSAMPLAIWLWAMCRWGWVNGDGRVRSIPRELSSCKCTVYTNISYYSKNFIVAIVK